MSKSVGGGFSVPDYGNIQPDKKYPAKGEEGHTKKISNLSKYLINDDYIQSKTHQGEKGSLDIASKPPSDLPPVFVDPSIPKDMAPSRPGAQPKVTHEKAPEVGAEVLRTKNSGIANKGHIAPKETELFQSPLMKKMKENTDVADTNALGYSYNPEFQMYVHPEKDALTQDEMDALLKGKGVTLQRKEVKLEEHSKELDEFAKKDFFRFDEEMHMYVSSNPFGGDRYATIDEMKGMMENKALEEKALAKGYKPVADAEGIFMNDAGDVKVADDFR